MDTKDKRKANSWIKENYPDGVVKIIIGNIEESWRNGSSNIEKSYVEWDLLLELMTLYLGDNQHRLEKSDSKQNPKEKTGYHNVEEFYKDDEPKEKSDKFDMNAPYDAAYHFNKWRLETPAAKVRNSFECFKGGIETSINNPEEKTSMDGESQKLLLSCDNKAITFANEINQNTDYDKGRWYGRIEGYNITHQPVREISKEEINTILNAIALLSSMTYSGETHSKESLLLKNEAVAILTKLNGE